MLTFSVGQEFRVQWDVFSTMPEPSMGKTWLAEGWYDQGFATHMFGTWASVLVS